MQGKRGGKGVEVNVFYADTVIAVGFYPLS